MGRAEMSQEELRRVEVFARVVGSIAGLLAFEPVIVNDKKLVSLGAASGIAVVLPVFKGTRVTPPLSVPSGTEQLSPPRQRWERGTEMASSPGGATQPQPNTYFGSCSTPCLFRIARNSSSKLILRPTVPPLRGFMLPQYRPPTALAVGYLVPPLAGLGTERPGRIASSINSINFSLKRTIASPRNPRGTERIIRDQGICGGPEKIRATADNLVLASLMAQAPNEQSIN